MMVEKTNNPMTKQKDHEQKLQLFGFSITAIFQETNTKIVETDFSIYKQKFSLSKQHENHRIVCYRCYRLITSIVTWLERILGSKKLPKLRLAQKLILLHSFTAIVGDSTYVGRKDLVV